MVPSGKCYFNINNSSRFPFFHYHPYHPNDFDVRQLSSNGDLNWLVK